MDSDFVEEFDTSSSESESGESFAKKSKLSEVASTSVQSYSLQAYHYHIPPPSYPHFQTPGFLSSSTPMYYQSQSPYHFRLPPPLPPPPPPQYSPYSDVIFRHPGPPTQDLVYGSQVPLNYATGNVSPERTEYATAAGAGESGIIRKKKRRRRCNNALKLSDYDDQVRSHAWRIYQKKCLESKLESCTKDESKEEEKLQITQSLEAIKKDLSTRDERSQDSPMISKLVNKITTQRRKRVREKVQRKQKSEEKQKKLELAKKRETEIDNWLKDQAISFEAEKKHQLFLKETRKSLERVLTKKRMLEDRMNILLNLQKLRNLRKNRMINTQPGFSSSSFFISDRNFSKEFRSLHDILKPALETIEREEQMIRAPMTPSKPVEATPVTSDIANNSADVTEKRQRKWEKYLSKKRDKFYSYVP